MPAGKGSPGKEEGLRKSARSKSVDAKAGGKEKEDMEEEAKELKGAWKGFKEVVSKCEGQGCPVWQVLRVPKQWKAEENKSFYCGICVGREVENLRRENASLREQMLQKADKSVEENLNVKITTYAEKLKENIRESKKEVLHETKAVAAASMGEEWRKEVRKEVKENTAEERRKKRLIVFGMREDEDDKQQVEEMLEKMEVEKMVVKVERMRKREGEGDVIKPVIVEFASEKDKWEVLEKKANLRKEERWKKVFLELDLSREKREERRQKAMERKEKKKQDREEEEKKKEEKEEEAEEEK